MQLIETAFSLHPFLSAIVSKTMFLQDLQTNHSDRCLLNAIIGEALCLQEHHAQVPGPLHSPADLIPSASRFFSDALSLLDSPIEVGREVSERISKTQALILLGWHYLCIGQPKRSIALFSLSGKKLRDIIEERKSNPTPSCRVNGIDIGLVEEEIVSGMYWLIQSILLWAKMQVDFNLLETFSGKQAAYVYPLHAAESSTWKLDAISGNFTSLSKHADAISDIRVLCQVYSVVAHIYTTARRQPMGPIFHQTPEPLASLISCVPKIIEESNHAVPFPFKLIPPYAIVPCIHRIVALQIFVSRIGEVGTEPFLEKGVTLLQCSAPFEIFEVMEAVVRQVDRMIKSPYPSTNGSSRAEDIGQSRSLFYIGSSGQIGFLASIIVLAADTIARVIEILLCNTGVIIPVSLGSNLLSLYKLSPEMISLVENRKSRLLAYVDSLHASLKSESFACKTRRAVKSHLKLLKTSLETNGIKAEVLIFEDDTQNNPIQNHPTTPQASTPSQNLVASSQNLGTRLGFLPSNQSRINAGMLKRPKPEETRSNLVEARGSVRKYERSRKKSALRTDFSASFDEMEMDEGRQKLSNAPYHPIEALRKETDPITHSIHANLSSDQSNLASAHASAEADEYHNNMMVVEDPIFLGLDDYPNVSSRSRTSLVNPGASQGYARFSAGTVGNPVPFHPSVAYNFGRRNTIAEVLYTNSTPASSTNWGVSRSSRRLEEASHHYFDESQAPNPASQDSSYSLSRNDSTTHFDECLPSRASQVSLTDISTSQSGSSSQAPHSQASRSGEHAHHPYSQEERMPDSQQGSSRAWSVRGEEMALSDAEVICSSVAPAAAASSPRNACRNSYVPSGAAGFQRSIFGAADSHPSNQHVVDSHHDDSRGFDDQSSTFGSQPGSIKIQSLDDSQQSRHGDHESHFHHHHHHQATQHYRIGSSASQSQPWSASVTGDAAVDAAATAVMMMSQSTAPGLMPSHLTSSQPQPYSASSDHFQLTSKTAEHDRHGTDSNSQPAGTDSGVHHHHHHHHHHQQQQRAQRHEEQSRGQEQNYYELNSFASSAPPIDDPPQSQYQPHFHHEQAGEEEEGNDPGSSSEVNPSSYEIVSQASKRLRPNRE
ncbi:hypothetical protein IE53DRAFT_386497 [Violaceomyces palustris]|uniref:Uncharacterized protein n=1 Tax=Violaceomyces palustris TaxID=1673888 RepID=A0ACD0NZ92_9BASI|nr:hypothetical protein IE53DRAFT_386497 [Violaceomyces palustris]